LNSLGLNTGDFPSIYKGVSTVAQTDAPTNIAPAVEQAFDSDDYSADYATTTNTTSINPNLVFPTTVSTWHPSLLSTSQSQSSTTRSQASPTPPSLNLEDFARENSLHGCNYGELLDDHLSSLLSDSSDKGTRTAQLRISPSDSLSDALNTSPSPSPSDSYKTGPLYPWIQTWPTQDLGDKAWSDVVSKKALSRPEWTIVQHLLRLYFQYLNPLLSVLKERDLYCLIHPDAQNDGISTKPISLALFNAIMFAASSASP